jgi:hypothetical protein
VSKVNFGFLEVDLNQFVAAVKNLVSGDLDKESKYEITKMIEEVKKTYDTTVISLLPFYSVVQSNDSTYVAQFTSQFVVFKQMYLTNKGELGVNCQVIKNNLDKLLKKKQWIGKLPRIKESLINLEYLAGKWSTSRGALEDSLEQFLSTVNETLDKINELNNTNASAESRSMLHVFLRESDETIKSIKQQLDSLKIISAKLL